VAPGTIPPTAKTNAIVVLAAAIVIVTAKPVETASAREAMIA